jgi:ribosomal protein L37AE/L43A
MKTIEQIRKEFTCPSCRSKKKLSFQTENAHCHKCNKDFDLGTKKYD